MKIGIISDTHGCVETWHKVFKEYLSEADLIIHAGDVLYHGPRNNIPAEYNPQQLAAELNNCPVPIVIAAGNCDAEVDGMVLDFPVQAPYAYIMAEGLRIIVNHGHQLSDEAKRSMAKKFKADLFITGHSHVAALEQEDGITYLNPGSPAMTKRADSRSTIAMLADNKVEIIDIATNDILMSYQLLK